MKRRGRIATVALVFAALLVIGAGLYVWSGLRPMPAKGEPVRVVIPAGFGTVAIGEKLQSAGIVRSGALFALYARMAGQGARFQAGEYDFYPGMRLEGVMAVMNGGAGVKPQVIRFTIPEGYTIKQIADKLGEQEGLDAPAFLAAAGGTEPFVLKGETIPNDPAVKYRLEGYLFPDTYEFKPGTPAKDIVARMLAQLDNKLAQLPAGWQDKLKARKLTLHQLLAVASMIEREVAVPAERPVVAGVIYNRLAKGMPLQIDATVQYALGEPKKRLFESDLQVDSPYNTYRNPGLPPGPIASPSMDAIQAALEPAESNYLFYVTKNDGSSEHYFSESYEQHNRNIERSKKNAAAHANAGG